MEGYFVKRNVKYLSLTILLLTIILVLLIRLNYPLKVSTTESIFHMIPIYYWILLLVIPALISAIFLLTESKIICVFLAVVYFFVLYSFFLFFVIPPTGADMIEGGDFFYLLRDTTHLSVEQFDYFQWPIHFLLNIVLVKILNIDFSILTLTLFSFILMMPIFFYLFLNIQSDKKIFFLLPVSYIILSYFFINLQWVPQFTGLIFLFLTIGCYIKYKEKESKIFYAMVLLFYTLCVFTHPFIFVFFPAAIIFDNYVLSKKIVKFKNKPTGIYFLILLSVIYLTGYVYRFNKMGVLTRRLFFETIEGRGEAWSTIASLIGSSQRVGLIDYDVFPLFDHVSNNIYFISRYATFILLIVFTLLLLYVLFKNIKKIKSFDISLGIAGSVFFIIGLINPVVLGQRAFQVIFLTVPRHFSNLFESKKKILIFLLVFCIILAPFLFTTNVLINQGISGERQIQDVATMQSGRFVMDFVKTKSNVLVADISFYPGRNNERYNFEIFRTQYIAEGTIEFADIDIIIDSPKQMNMMKYYGLELNYNDTSKLYDNGLSQVLIR